MNVLIKTISLLLIGSGCWLCTVGCTSNQLSTSSDWKGEVLKWERDGWKQEDVLGEPGKYTMSSFIKSNTARIITAFYITGGVRSTKEYEQMKKKYLIITFSKINGDSFAVVLSR